MGKGQYFWLTLQGALLKNQALNLRGYTCDENTAIIGQFCA